VPIHWAFKVLVYLGLAVASAPISAQTTSQVSELPVSRGDQAHWFLHDKQLLASYDSVADSTHLALVTHKGKYFLWNQRPRLTWTVTYVGRTPPLEPPQTVELVFRTQNPQVPTNKELVIEFAPTERVEVTSVGAHSDPGPMVWSHFMRFPIPTADLVKGLAGERMQLRVGGIRVDFKPDHMEAMRHLLRRVGAWPVAVIPVGGA
jgi:hypothetical protein